MPELLLNCPAHAEPARRSPPPRVRSDVIVRPLGEAGRYVVKNPADGKFFTVGEQEAFLFSQLDGTSAVAEVCRSFEDRFGEPLTDDDLQEFLALAHKRGLLEPDAQTASKADPRAPQPGSPSRRRWTWPDNLFYIRYSFFDPNRLFDRIEPRIRWFWSRSFFLGSAVWILLALLTVWAHRLELISKFPNTLTWQTALAVWAAIVVLTTCHECAHGLTCKHYGGEVHEIGFLLIFFTPAFYCNVSDAWLFPKKSQRLWVGFAGIYIDLCVWAAAVFLWRVSVQDGLLNYLAWVVISVCGARTLLNLNPLMKLDGYYLLGDWLEMHNLRRRGQAAWLGWIRWALWGANRPAPEPRGRLIACYGAASWTFTLGFLLLLFLGLARFRSAPFGPLSLTISLLLFVLISRGLFRGFTSGEVHKMIGKRHKRTVFWLAAVGLVPASLFLGHANDRVGGSFLVRPQARMEIRSPETGFLQTVEVQEGSPVAVGSVVGRLHVPDLESNITKKRAEVRECTANVQRLEAGPRREELAEQRQRVERAVAWRDLARQDLARSRQAYQEDLSRLDQLIAQSSMELDYRKQASAAAQKLFGLQAMSEDQYLAEKKRLQIAESQWRQAFSQKRSREAAGTLETEAELARREKELADVRAALSLMQAGTRPEEIEAERARLARLQEELRYLDVVQERTLLRSPAAGLITTARMLEKKGQYFEKGAVICVVEDVSAPEIEVALAEEDESHVQPGQSIALKARALPFTSFRGRVERKSSSAAAVEGRSQSTMIAYCRVEGDDAARLLPGMTGYARIYCGDRSLAAILAAHTMQFLRTEFWW